MRKQLLTIGAIVLSALSLNAQSTFTHQNSRLIKSEVKKSNSNEKTLLGTLVCNTQYVAGTTMDLEFTLDLSTTADDDWCDLFSMTFPAGITPNSSTTDPMETNIDAVGGQSTSQLNPISGQTISWGQDDDATYGGIMTLSYTFIVNVTIAPGTTGNKTVSFLASSDQYGSTPGDLNGSGIIYPVGPDVKGYVVSPGTFSLNNCDLGTTDIIAGFINASTISLSNIPVKYSINNGTAVSGTIAGPVAAGDTAYITFTTQGNFPNQAIYNIKAWSEYVGDLNNNNDSTSTDIINSLTTNLETTAYSNGIESDYDLASIKSDWAGAGVAFGPSVGTIHSGSQALYYTVNTGMGAPAGDYETFAILPCTDVVSGNTYRISYWRKSNIPSSGTANGKSGIFAGSTQEANAMTTVIKAYSTITPNAQASTWEKDSADYVATSTGTIYFAIGGKGTVATGNQINVRLDDINIVKVGQAGINEISNEVSVYPNPANDILNFKLNVNATSIAIIGLDGKVYSTTSVNGNSTSVNVANLASGIYVYEIVSENGSITRNTFVKK